MIPELSGYMKNVRSKCPLVHHITNYVTVNDCANICICSGGSPVMTDAAEDIRDMVKISNAVVLNMGTLNPRTVESMILAGKVAKENGIPVLFDAVGAGATGYRSDTAARIINEVRPDVIKGNAGEISYLAGVEGCVRGVDSSGATGDMSDTVRELSKKYGCLVVSTGKEDHVSDGESTYVLSNGHDLQGCVSGTGCMLSSVLGSYIGANGPKAEAVLAGITAFNIAAENASKVCKGPGSFKVALLDSLFGLGPEQLDKDARIRKV